MPTLAPPAGWVDVAGTFDAATRLAEGLAGVTDVEGYVSACHALGYQHPDLTTHAAQIRDWYASEEGMDLRALETDSAALQAVTVAVDEALARQDAQRATLAAAWQGAGAHASREFLARHEEASAHALAAVRTAAHTLADLRDRLWQAVDGKVATVLAIDDSVQARRGDWLAAAQTVTTGAGDRAVASELVDQEVKPFVESAIAGQWLSAMRAAVDAIEAAYDAANAELASQASMPFEVPGELGPTWTPATEPTWTPATEPAASAPAPAASAPAPAAGAVAPAVNALPVSPAGWTPPAAPAGASFPAPASATPVPAAPLPVDPGAATPGISAPSLPSLGGGGLPDIGSGLSSFGQQLGDLFGGLLGAGDGGSDPGEIEDPLDIDEPDEPDDLEEADDLEENDDLEETSDEPDDVAENGESKAAVDEEKPEELVDPAASNACPPEQAPPVPVDMPPQDPAATPPPEPADPVAAAPEPLAAPPEPPVESGSGTPCEIAADELPQVGE